MNAPASAPPFLGAALLLADADAVMAPAAVTEVETGLYTGTLTAIGADGRVEVAMPSGDELPAALLSPAGEFFYGFDYTTCELVTSVPDAQVTAMVFGLVPFPLPGVMLFAAQGNDFAIATSAPVDVDDPAVQLTGFVSWIYADTAVEISTPDAGCLLDTLPIHADLALTEGWNQVEFVGEFDPVTDTATSFSITNSAYEELYFNAGLL